MTKPSKPTKPKARATPSRTPPGLSGEKISDYPKLTMRVPQETVDRLREFAERTGQEQWRVLHDAVQAYEPVRPAATRGRSDI